MSSVFKCDFCQVTMTGHNQYVQHMSGKKHLKKTQTGDADPESTADTVSTADDQFKNDGQNGDDPVKRAVLQNMMSAMPQKRKMEDDKCELCDVKYDSQTVKMMHLKGSKHAKKMKLSDPNAPVSEATYYCSFCNIKVNAPDQMDTHRLGERHRKKLAVAREIQQMTDVTGPPSSDGIITSIPANKPPPPPAPTAAKTPPAPPAPAASKPMA